MAEKNNAVCDICGKEYYVCLSCSDAMRLHPYKSFTDTAEHFKIFQVVKGFLTGVYTKEEAKEKFENIDLSDINSFKPHIKDIIKNVLKEEKADVKEVTVKEVAVEGAKVAEETIAVEETTTDEVIVKPTVSRKRNSKVETE